MGETYNISLVQKRSEYIQAYDFEVVDFLTIRDYVVAYRPLMYSILGVYLLGIYFGPKWMEKRPPFRLNGALFFWNAFLAVFSVIATIRGCPETIFLLSKPSGFYWATCSEEFTNYATVFWGMLFGFSKILELGDTAFIILRKQKLIVLHWFHHISMVLSCWIALEYVPAGGRFYFVNTFVHSFMYSYYALKALRFKIPKKVSMALTLLQIVQLIIGVFGVFYVAYILYTGIPCRLHRSLVYLAGVLGPIILGLFLNFFLQTYLQRNKVKAY